MAVAALVAVLAVLLRAAVPGLLVLLLALAALLVRRPRRRGRAAAAWAMTVTLAGLALVLALGVELFVVSRIDIGRTNTVFKTYLQVWVLLAVAAAVCVPVTYARLAAAHPAVLAAWRTGFVLLLASALLYPLLASQAKARDRFAGSTSHGLDGTAFMRTATYGIADTVIPLAPDLQAIRWFQTSVRGTPTIAEANTYPTLYGWGNRFAMSPATRR